MWNPNIYKENKCKPSTKHAKKNVQIVDNTEIRNKKTMERGNQKKKKKQIPIFVRGGSLAR